MNAVAKNLRKLRQSQGLSQEQLAQKLFVTRQAVSNWETGKTQPDTDTLVNIAQILAIDVTELIYGKKTHSAFEADKKIRIKRTACLVMIALFAFATKFIFTLCLKPQATNSYTNIVLVSVLESFVTVLTYGLSAACFVSLISIWKDISITNAALRKAFLLGGVGITGIYTVFVVLHILGFSAFWRPIYFVTTHPVIAIVPALCIFAGLNK